MTNDNYDMTVRLLKGSINPNTKANAFGSQGEKTRLRGVANNTGADQTVHLHSLISTFVTLLFAFWKVPHVLTCYRLTEETGLRLALSETPKLGFVTTRTIF